MADDNRLVPDGNGPGLKPEEEKQRRFMEAIAKEASKHEDLVLKGGGALIFGYGLDRFSDDLDFDARQSPELETLFKTAAKASNTNIEDIRIRKDTETVKRYKIDCATLNQNGEKEHAFTLKVEVSMRNKTIDQNQTTLVNGVKVYRIGQLIGQKLGAFEHRSIPRARDLSDMVFLAENYGQYFSREQSDTLMSLIKDPDELAFKYAADHATQVRIMQPLDDLILRLDAAGNQIAASLSRQYRQGSETA